MGLAQPAVATTQFPVLRDDLAFQHLNGFFMAGDVLVGVDVKRSCARFASRSGWNPARYACTNFDALAKHTASTASPRHTTGPAGDPLPGHPR